MAKAKKVKKTIDKKQRLMTGNVRLHFSQKTQEPVEVTHKVASSFEVGDDFDLSAIDEVVEKEETKKEDDK